MIKARLAAGEVLVGTFAALGSAVAVEALARAGLDFVVADLEHGAGDESRLLPLLLAAERGGAHALVRVESTVRERTTRALDLGAEGIVAPRVDSAAEAAAWATALRYGAEPGARGVALGTRGAGFGLDPASLDRQPLGVAQVESPAAVGACDAIAAVDGVDVLFVGPSDLSHALGCFREWDHPELRAATARVVAAAHAAGKFAGTFCPTPEQVPAAIDAGFSLIAVGTDVALLVAGGRTIAASI